jgi:beta-mannosidase
MNSSLLVVALAWLGFGTMQESHIAKVDLNGEWRLTQGGKPDALLTHVPGNVHLDLIREGRIPDPFYRDNAAKIEWVYEATWVYERSFDVPADMLKHAALLLRCEGLDTVARIEVNGQHVGNADNMYRTWEFDVKPLLREGKNEIRITFSPVKEYIEAFQKRAPQVPNATGIDIANIRKPSYSNSWDFCAKFLPCGIHKPIAIVGYDTARIQDVQVHQNLSESSAKLAVNVVAERISSPELTAEAVVQFQGKIIDRQEAPLVDGATTIPLEVLNPQLWWPVGMGNQPLYEVAVQLRDGTGITVDAAHRRVGLRRLELLPKSDDRPLRLAVNGQEIFAKGANWIPADVFPARVTADKLRQYVSDAVAVNMNMLRVWGGGYYPDDAFFDACDEMGILVWMDFPFACAPYPGNNPEFQENVRAELTDQVRRLRHHPSIAVWCGNNEVEGLITSYKLITREEYDRLFHEVIGTKVKELFPEIIYVGGSPEAGDEHNWWVWHVGADFEHYRQSHGWMTEFGFQSFPHPATVNQYTEVGDRDSVFSEINLFHQKNGNGKGNQIILDKLEGYFRKAKDFESTLWLSQILQSYGMNIGIEHWRTDWPHSSGSFVWQYNDCWPGPSWSSVDYYGRWKAAHYGYRRVYAPVMVAGLVEAETSNVQVKVASDLKETLRGRVTWRLTDLAGQLLEKGEHELDLPAGAASTVGPKLEIGERVTSLGPEKVLLWLDVTAGEYSHNNLVLFKRPKDLDLLEPNIKAETVAVGDGYNVTLTASAPALWVWLTLPDADARYSDNFMHLYPGEPVTIHVTPSQKGKSGKFQDSLQVRSLRDTYVNP